MKLVTFQLRVGKNWWFSVFRVNFLGQKLTWSSLTLLHVGRGVYQTLVTVIVADPTGAEILDWKLDDNFILGTQ